MACLLLHLETRLVTLVAGELGFLLLLSPPLCFFFSVVSLGDKASLGVGVWQGLELPESCHCRGLGGGAFPVSMTCQWWERSGKVVMAVVETNHCTHEWSDRRVSIFSFCREFPLFPEEEDDGEKWKTAPFVDWAAVFNLVLHVSKILNRAPRQNCCASYKMVPEL